MSPLIRLPALLALGLATLGCTTARAARSPDQPAPATQRAGLHALIDSMVRAPAFRNAHWGILIVNPGTGETLYSRNAGKLFMPASNMKIVTGSVALATLGPDFRFRTAFAARGRIRDGALDGDLIVIGRGDPTLSEAMWKDAMFPLQAIADSLTSHGISRITGRILAGPDAFPDAPYGYGWSWDDFNEPYSAGVDALFFNEGFTHLTIRAGTTPGSRASATTAPIHDWPPVRVNVAVVPRSQAAGDVPSERAIAVARDTTTGGFTLTGQLAPGDTVAMTLAFPDQRAAYLAALRQALTGRGVSVGGATPAAGGATPAAGERTDTIFVLASPPLRDILPHFLKPSQNQIGEILLKTIGLERTGVGTADSGRAVEERTLLAWGAERDGFVIRDGSGLARYDYLTPETIVRTLAAVRGDSAFHAFYDALPIAGVDGTIARRLQGTPAQGNAHAKTGFVAQARSLSGYVTTADGQLVIFSLLCNNWTAPVREVEHVQDAIVARLAGMRLGTMGSGAADR